MNNSQIYSSISLPHDFRFKIILTGNSVVGKTSLISSYVDNHFQTNTLPTLGVDFKVIKNELFLNFHFMFWSRIGFMSFLRFNLKFLNNV